MIHDSDRIKDTDTDTIQIHIQIDSEYRKGFRLQIGFRI